MIVGMPRRMAQPQCVARVDWGNPITQGLAFAYLPGFGRDAVTNTAVTAFKATARPLGASLFTNRTSGNGLEIASGGLLGPLQSSTVIALITPSSTAGSAIYSERALGNDIYKLELEFNGSGRPNFTYRNDAGVLIQNPVPVSIQAGVTAFIAARKNGTAVTTHFNKATASGTFGSTSTAFTNAVVRTIGYDAGDASIPYGGLTHVVAGWSRALSDAEMAALIDNPWQIFAPIPRIQPAFATGISITRPNSDITVAGWTSTGANYFDPLADSTDATFDTSPDVTAPTPLVVGLDSSLAAGTYDITVRALRTGTTGRVRVLLLDGSGATVGTSSFQTITGSFTDYVLSVTTTGTATRAQIEVTT